MTPQFSSRRDFGSDEHGALLPLFALLFVVLLAISGLAVDAANLYRARLLLQKAADVAALGAIAYTIERGRADIQTDLTAEGFPQTPDGYARLVERRAHELLLENLALNEIDHIPCNDANGNDVCAAYDEVNREVTVDLAADVDLYLIDLVPFEMIGAASWGRSVRTAASARAARPPANVALLLDVSGSMGCPADPNNDCSCRLAGAGGCGGQRIKVDDLSDGVLEFLNYFDLEHDHLGIIPFNTRARRIPGGLENIDPELVDADTVSCLLAGQGLLNCSTPPPRVPQGGTNIADAMVEAYEEMLDQGVVNVQDVSYLLFSDGAPDAGRFFFNDQANLPINDPNGFGGTTRDYIQYALKYDLPDGTSFIGPSLLVKTDALQFLAPTPLPPIPDPQQSGAFVPMCHSHMDGSGQVSQIFGPQQSDEFCNVFNGCLSAGPAGPSGLGFYLPRSPVKYAADVICDNANQVSRETSWKRQYFHFPIAMADFMRENRGTVSAIGLGPVQAGGVAPYLDVNNTAFRNDYFLRRIANDHLHAVAIPTNDGDNATVPDAEFSFGGYASYDSLNSRSIPRHGDYLATPDSARLKDLFRVMAKRIALRMTR